MEREKARLVGGPIDEEEKLDGEGWRVISAMRMYEDNVADLDGDDQVSRVWILSSDEGTDHLVQPINMANLRVEAQDEQDFLKTHYETLQKDREKDPRAAFAARPNSGSALNGVDSLHGASVVGPMASSSLSLPSVERALERDPEDVTARLAKMVRKVRSPLLLAVLLDYRVLTSRSPAGLVARSSLSQLARLRLPSPRQHSQRPQIGRAHV